MKIHIVGDGSFGRFLKELLPTAGFELDQKADAVILAVPISVYADVSMQFRGHHIINVCSSQEPSMKALYNAGHVCVTGLHPLFGRRTPAEFRSSILTQKAFRPEAETFLRMFEKISTIHTHWADVEITPEIHDRLMARTHKAAIKAASDLKPTVERAADIPDYLIPNSFRLLRQFVSTMEDMPSGTLESILANQFE